MKNKEITQIKSLIKRAINIVGSSGSKVTLSTADDCSLFVSNLFGYRNWQEVRDESRFNDKLLEIDGNFNSYTLNKIKEIKAFNFSQVELKFKKQNYQRIKRELNVPKVNPKEIIDIGFVEDDYLKSINVVGIRQENTVIISRNENVDFIDFWKKRILENNIPFITFSDNPNVVLDPWAMMLKSNHLETFFMEVPSGFASIFTQIVRDLQLVSVRVDLTEVIDWLNLNNFLSLISFLKEKNLPSYQFISLFLRSIGVKNYNESLISEDMQKRYWIAIEPIFNILCELNHLYEDGVFKRSYGEDELLDLVAERKSIVFSPKEINNPIYSQVLRLELNRVFTLYEDSMDTSPEQYMYWLFLENVERFNFSWEWVYEYKFLRTMVTSNGQSEFLKDYLLVSPQILIGVLSSLDLDDVVKRQLLSNVISWPSRFWYRNSVILNYLEGDEFYLISPLLSANSDLDFADYNCSKIKVDFNTYDD